MPLLNMRLARPAVLVDLNGIQELRGLVAEDEAVSIGALTRHAELEDSPFLAKVLPLLPMAVRYIGHRPIRNRGTLGGSLAHNDPAAELPLVARALEAEIEVASVRGVRVVPAEAFFVTYMTTDLAPDEILTRVRFPQRWGRCGAGFSEVARRAGDFALVAAAALLELEGDVVRTARVFLGGVDAVPVRSEAAEALLVGEVPDLARCARAAAAAAEALLDPPADLHASADVRRTLAGAVVRRALVEAARNATQEEAETDA
jgi:carbon-monoxide dehydrogenase medium subunit